MEYPVTSREISANTVVIIGGGPAGLMAAEVAIQQGANVILYEAKGSVGRKFLLAGKGGLNLTHSEPFADFLSRFGSAKPKIESWLGQFNADDLRQWAKTLGFDTYIGSSGRVFPLDRKAAPLLRTWVRKLKERGVEFCVNHYWEGWTTDGELRFKHPSGFLHIKAPATVLALGGASWPELGSDGQWQSYLTAQSISISPLKPSNCGFDCDWSPYFSQHYAGTPLKPVVAYFSADNPLEQGLQGECVITETGIEGSLIYALSAQLRDAIAEQGCTSLYLDVMPNRSLEWIQSQLQKPQGKRSFSEFLRRQLGLPPVIIALLYETIGPSLAQHRDAIPAELKRFQIVLNRPRPIAEAISTAGGICFNELTSELMLQKKSGVFCCGEMLDWEAPTGGYLLTACFSSGFLAGNAAASWVQTQ